MSDNVHNDINIPALDTQHECEQCGKIIEKGHPAVHSHGVYYGDNYDHYTHLKCHAAARIFAGKTSHAGVRSTESRATRTFCYGSRTAKSGPWISVISFVRRSQHDHPLQG